MGRIYSQLNEEERTIIDRLLKEGKGPSAIGLALGRSKGTISRELYRNHCDGLYFYWSAQIKAAERRWVASSKSRVDLSLLKRALKKLEQKWSPDQISKRMLAELGRTISATTIYKNIWLDRDAGGKLYQHLRISNRRRKKRNIPLRTKGPIEDKKSIHLRPKIVEKREREGDLEGDTIHFGGKDNRKGGLLTMSDRVSKIVKIRKLKKRSGKITARKMKEVINSLGSCHSVTLDNGSEFTEHKKVEELTGVEVYFADPYCSSQRGSIENMNGLIRQFFGKKYQLRDITSAKVRVVENLLNNRPRKTLGYRTPNEVHSKIGMSPQF